MWKPLRQLIDRYLAWRNAPAARSSNIAEPDRIRADVDPSALGRAMGAGEGNAGGW